ncbi:ALI_HP2_G0033660.mRNA.1.CDS.1 [Saccharomyces cerevisiae]|nr:ALI_HP2_G0033660.mRNA.1.CDS.1 [Saccharomyces cerevisiae]CAI6557845.1 ALI_HP2_G0033660.mRNA.1.CDS.1 [Saccharomyces cerevisiae]
MPLKICLYSFPPVAYISTNNKNKYNGQINFNRCWCCCHRSRCCCCSSHHHSFHLTKESTWSNWVFIASDIRAHLAQYYFYQHHPTEAYPVEIVEAVFNYGETSPLC